MEVNKKKIATAVAASMIGAAAVSLPLSNTLAAEHKGYVKCYGVAKAGKNDCGTKVHSCAGQSKASYDKSEWKYMKKKNCEQAKANVKKLLKEKNK